LWYHYHVRQASRRWESGPLLLSVARDYVEAIDTIERLLREGTRLR